MPLTNFPGAIDSFTPNTDGIDDVTALNVNELQAAAIAIETELINNLFKGWITETGTWAYASPTTFTMVGDVTAKFGKGTKLKLTQTTVKYFYVVASSYSAPNTTVTVTGGSGYALVNAAITSPYYSYADAPQGFPDWFAYATVWTASGGGAAIGNGTLASRFSISGHTVTLMIYMILGSTTTPGTGEWRWTSPVAALNAYMQAGGARFIKAGVSWYEGSAGFYENSTINTTATYTSSVVGHLVPFTWGDGDKLGFTFMYEF